MVVTSGHIRLEQEGTLSRRRAASAQAACWRVPRYVCAVRPAFTPQVLLPHKGPTERLWQTQSTTPDLRGKACSALFPTMASHAGLTCWTSCRHSLWSGHIWEKVVPPACLPGSNPKQIPSNTQQQQTTVANAPGQTLSSFLMSHWRQVLEHQISPWRKQSGRSWLQGLRAGIACERSWEDILGKLWFSESSCVCLCQKSSNDTLKSAAFQKENLNKIFFPN